jgi:hypothetical protein
MSTATESPRPTGEFADQYRVTVLRAGGFLVTLCAAVGAVVALMSGLRTTPESSGHPAFEVGIAHPASTSFGTVAVEFAQFLGGPSLNALNGSAHNVGALVPPNKMQVEATVTITNFSKSPVKYSPTQFGLMVGANTKPILATRASVGEGTLQPDAGIDVRLTFVTGLTKKDLELRYLENDGSGPILMRLGHHTVTTQRAHGEKPGQILGVGQTFHQHHDASGAAPGANATSHVHNSTTP